MPIPSELPAYRDHLIPEPKLLPTSYFLQPHLSSDAGIAYPLRLTPRRNKEALALIVKYFHWGRVGAPSLPALDLEKVIMAGSLGAVTIVTCHLRGAEYVCYFFPSWKYGLLSDGYLASSHTVC